MILLRNISILEKYTMYRASLYSFWKNLSGHFDRFACNHSYGYAHNVILGRIGQTDSLTDFIKHAPIVCIPMKYQG